MEGAQVVVELVDADPTLEHELIDRFIINITELEREKKIFIGIFGLANFSATIDVACFPEFTSCPKSSSATSLPIPPTISTTLQEVPEKAELSTSWPFILSMVLAVIVVGLITAGVCVSVCAMRKRKKELSHESVRYSNGNGGACLVINAETNGSQAHASNCHEVSYHLIINNNLSSDN